MNTNRDVAALAGRVLLALLFVFSGWGKLTGFAGAVGYITGAHLPMPDVVAALVVVIELGGGLMLALGWKARWVALALAVFTVLASLLFHDFWNLSGAERMNNQIHFLKNLSIVGGMLMVFAFGPGRLSLDKG